LFKTFLVEVYPSTDCPGTVETISCSTASQQTEGVQGH